MVANETMTPLERRRHGDHLHRMLLAKLIEAGCFRRTTVRTTIYTAGVVAGYAGAYVTLLSAPGVVVRLLALVTLAFLSVHAGFIAHEAGHGAITRSRRVATALGQFLNTFLTALSYSYYQHIHRRHHPHCNDRQRDPDLQSGAFSMYRQSAETKSGLGGLVSRHQSVLVWILVWLQGFTLKLDSLGHLRRNPERTRVDQVVLVGHVALWFGLPVLVLGFPAALLNYAVMTLFIGPYLGTIFLVNHLGTEILEPDDGISFFMREVRTTRNLGTSWLSDFLSGGLANHVEHHLFPTIPSGRLRAARVITREFCHAHGVAYREMSWLAGAREVTRHFKAMSAFVPR